MYWVYICFHYNSWPKKVNKMKHFGAWGIQMLGFNGLEY